MSLQASTILGDVAGEDAPRALVSESSIRAMGVPRSQLLRESGREGFQRCYKGVGGLLLV